MTKKILILLFFCSIYISAQNLGVSNQLEYSYDVDRKIEILENWFNADLRYDYFSAGLRLDVFQPNDPDPSISRGKERYAGIDYKYLKLELGESDETLEITAGNYYALLGRGMVLRSYEDRTIRVDNNLLGFKVKGTYKGFVLTALSGSAENSAAERKDILHAADIEYRGFDFMNIGATYGVNIPDDENSSRNALLTARIEPSIWNFDLYSEYGVRFNDDLQNKYFGGEKIAGKGYYGNLSFYYDRFSVIGEYKYYDNFVLRNSDGTTSYNQPPAGRKEYTYLLLNRHPYPLNQANEKGYQFDMNYNLTEETYFNASYGRTLSQSSGSYFQRMMNVSADSKLLQEEAFIMGYHPWNESFISVAALGYNREAQSDTKSITPVLETKYYFGEINTIRLILEHQQTFVTATNEKYYDDALTLEYLRSPAFSVAVVSEMKTIEPVKDHVIRKFWNLVQFGYKIAEHTDVTLLFGSRQAGIVCIGGVCRYEPEFSGVEIKLFTRI